MNAPAQFVHATRKLDVENPFRLYGGVVAAVGLVLCVLGGGPMLDRLSDGTVARLFERGIEPRALAPFWKLLVAAITVLLGLSFVGRGVQHLIRLWVPPGTPQRFRDQAEVLRALKLRQIAAYDAPDVARLWSIRQILGDRILLLAPRLRAVAVDLINEARRGALIGLTLLAILLVPPGVFTDRDARLLWSAVRSLEFPPLLAVLAVAAALRVVCAVLLVPRRIPETLSHRRNQYVDGGGHPSALMSRLEETARFLDWNGLPVRIAKEEPTLHAGGVSDAGTFKGSMLVEDQPRPLPHERHLTAAGLLLAGGGTALIAGFWTLGDVRIADLIQAAGRPVHGLRPAFGILLSLVLVVLGRRLLGHARRITSGFGFHSKLFLLEIDGTFTRAQVTVGKAVMDSIESQNLVVRSEFSIVYHAAEAVSETIALDQPRELLEIRATPEILDDLVRFESTVTSYQAKGARPVGVELGDPATHDIIRANLSISGLRRGNRPVGEMPGAPTPPELTPPVAKPPALSASSDGPTKECPECAETIKAAAKKCRFCGHRFDGGDGSQ